MLLKFRRPRINPQIQKMSPHDNWLSEIVDIINECEMLIALSSLRANDFVFEYTH